MPKTLRFSLYTNKYLNARHRHDDRKGKVGQKTREVVSSILKLIESTMQKHEEPKKYEIHNQKSSDVFTKSGTAPKSSALLMHTLALPYCNSSPH